MQSAVPFLRDETRPKLHEVICNHLCREGMQDVADQLMKASLTVTHSHFHFRTSSSSEWALVSHYWNVLGFLEYVETEPPQTIPIGGLTIIDSWCLLFKCFWTRHGFNTYLLMLIWMTFQESNLTQLSEQLEDFKDVNFVVSALRKKDLKPAMTWVEQNRTKLNEKVRHCWKLASMQYYKIKFYWVSIRISLANRIAALNSNFTDWVLLECWRMTIPT